jgi:hypothetical protein
MVKLDIAIADWSRPTSRLRVTLPESRIDLEIQLLRLVQLALAGAEIVTGDQRR